MRRATFPLALAVLAACGDKPADDAVDTEIDDTEVVDTDPDDTQVIDTEVVDSDTDVVDTDTDTDVSVLLVTVPTLRLGTGGAVIGDIVQIEEVVVTAVRSDGSGFFVQDPAATSYGGLFVKTDGTLPPAGKRVTLVGRYQELGGGSVPLQTQATLDASSSVPGGGVTEVATAAVPSAIPLIYASNLFGHGEQYESMLVRISVAGANRLVVDGPAAGDGSFLVRPPPSSTTKLKIGAWFTDPSAGLADFDAGASFASIRGVIGPDGGLSLQPLAAGDLTDYRAAAGGGDTDTDTVVDTDTDTQVDSPIDTFVDTFVPEDSDTGGGGGGPGSAELTPQQIHAGLPTADATIVTVKNVVVTAVKDGSAAQDYFVVQALTGTTDAGLFIDANDSQAVGLTLPAVGDIIDVTGMYTEYPSTGGSTGIASQSRLDVNPPVYAGSGWTVKSSGNALPTPVDVTPATFASASTMEDYESMRVRLIEPGYDITVYTVSGAIVKVGTPSSAARVELDSLFYSVGSYGMTVGKVMDSITGIYYAKYPYGTGVPMRLSPTTAGDVVNLRVPTP